MTMLFATTMKHVLEAITDRGELLNQAEITEMARMLESIIKYEVAITTATSSSSNSKDKAL